MKTTTERNRLDELLALARAARQTDELESIALSERESIAALIELREGPGRFLLR